jgi:hypothetical protein
MALLLLEGDVEEPEPEPGDCVGGGEEEEREDVDEAAEPEDLRLRGVMLWLWLWCFGVWNRGCGCDSFRVDGGGGGVVAIGSWPLPESKLALFFLLPLLVLLLGGGLSSLERKFMGARMLCVLPVAAVMGDDDERSGAGAGCVRKPRASMRGDVEPWRE